MLRGDDLLSMPDTSDRTANLEKLFAEYNAHKAAYKAEKEMMSQMLKEASQDYCLETSTPVLTAFPGRVGPPPPSATSATAVPRESLVDVLATHRAWMADVVDNLISGEMQNLPSFLTSEILYALAECDGTTLPRTSNNVLVMVLDYKNALQMIQHRLTTQAEARKTVASRECLGIVDPLSHKDYVYLVRHVFLLCVASNANIRTTSMVISRQRTAR